MNIPLVSVLMTAYNREKYIAASIESVLASSYTDFELIIVDDGSSDRTVEIARSYESKDKRIKVFINEKNLGDYFNRNKAASYAKGKYIKYLDSDDLIYPHGLEVMVNCMEKFPGVAVGIMSQLNQEEIPFPFLLEPETAYQYHFYKRGLFDTGPSGLIFSTEKFRQIGGFTGKRYVGDLEINMKLAAKWSIVRMPASLVFWVQHEGQEFVIGQNSTGYLELELPVYQEALSKGDCPLQPSQREEIIKYFRKVSARRLLNIAILKRNPSLAWNMYKKLSLEWMDMKNAVFFMKKKY
jgi:glycosyltransferase involved in cell wall biosynthesis